MKKSEYLRKAASTIRAYPWAHHWSDPARCNCGILAQVVLDLDAVKLREKFIPPCMTTWTRLLEHTRGEAASRCPITNMDTLEMLTKLTEAGFTPEELHGLEYLSKGHSRHVENHTSHNHVMDYMDEWAQELELQGL